MFDNRTFGKYIAKVVVNTIKNEIEYKHKANYSYESNTAVAAAAAAAVPQPAWPAARRDSLGRRRPGWLAGAAAAAAAATVIFYS